METPEKNGFSPITIIILIAIVIIGALWYSSKNTETVENPNINQQATSTEPAATSTPVVENVLYVNTEHQFEFMHPNTWATTTALNVGLYKDAIAFVPKQEEATILAAEKKTSEQLKELVQDQALLIKFRKSNSTTVTLQSEYGSNITIDSRLVDGKNVARIVHSKSTDPVNWQGGSKEAYLIRNSLGEVIIIEANYGTDEIDTEGDLRRFLETVVGSFKIRAN